MLDQMLMHGPNLIIHCLMQFRSTFKKQPNTIQQDIHPNIRLAGNSPAGCSAETILLPITQKIRHYGKNESYFTQWHTRGFQNIKLVFH